MRIIKKNAITTIVASSSDAGHPVENLLNSSPKKKWTAEDASVSHAVLDITVSGITGALGMVGIAAESVTVTIANPTGIVWRNTDWRNVTWRTGEAPMQVAYDWSEIYSDFKTVWAAFDRFDAPVTIRIELFKRPENPVVLSAGVLVVGESIDLPGVQYPIEEGLQDYSISEQLANGAFYYKRRDIVRRFRVSLLVNRESHYQMLMRDLARLYGLDPVMVMVAEGLGSDFLVYARLDGMPNGSHVTRNYSSIQLGLIEVL